MSGAQFVIQGKGQIERQTHKNAAAPSHMRFMRHKFFGFQQDQLRGKKMRVRHHDARARWREITNRTIENEGFFGEDDGPQDHVQHLPRSYPALGG